MVNMKKLHAGIVDKDKLDKLIWVAGIKSENLIKSINNHLVLGMSMTNSLVGGQKLPNLSRAVKRLEAIENKLKLLGE